MEEFFVENWPLRAYTKDTFTASYSYDIGQYFRSIMETGKIALKLLFV